MEAPPPPPLLLLLLGALLAPSAANTSAAPAPTVEVLVGVLLPEDLSFPWARLRVAPALSLALKALEPHLRHAGLAVRTVFASTEHDDAPCNEAMAQFKAAELRGSHDPDVLLGLECFDRNDPREFFAHYWQLPILRAGYYGADTTAVNFGPLGSSHTAFKSRLLRHFNWIDRPVLIISSENEGWLYSYVVSEEPPHYYASDPRRHDSGEAVQFIQAYGRVAYISGSLEMLQEIIHLAEAQNMTNGDYVFFYLDPYGESMRAEGHREAAKPWQSKETQDTRSLREAFQTVLVITSHEPQTPEYRRFQSQLILRTQKDFGVTLNDSLGHLVAGCFYDGLQLYLRVLNETLREGGTKRDTSRILEKMRGQTFQGVTGTVSINSNNDRETDFDLWATRNVTTGEFQVVGHYIGSEKRINWLGTILWKKGASPFDNPASASDMDDLSYGMFSHIRT